jgi:hypothetical protein
MGVVGPAVSADDARRRSDQAVRRIREESGRRVEERRRSRAFSSWCALAALAGGISLAALDAHDACLARQEAEALRVATQREARIAEACAARTARFLEIQEDMAEKLSRAMSVAVRAHIRTEAVARRAAAVNAAADAGCGHHVVTPDSWRADQPSPPVKAPIRRDACGGDPIIEGL